MGDIETFLTLEDFFRRNNELQPDWFKWVNCAWKCATFAGILLVSKVHLSVYLNTLN